MRTAALAVALVTLVTRLSSAAPTVTPIAPTSGSGGPYSIAFVADGFTDLGDFNSAVTMITTKLLNAEFYKDHQNLFTVVSVFEPSSGSRFHFAETFGGTCRIGWAADTNDLIDAAVEPLDPSLTIVLGNNDVGQYGCSTAEWMYLTSGTRFAGTVLPHELGHEMVNLYDEYVDFGTPYPDGPVNRANCSTVAPPYWTTLTYPGGVTPPTSPDGCDRYATGVKRPYSDDCRMKDDSRLPHFCTICAATMCVAAANLLHVSPSEMCSIVPPQPPKAPTDLRIIKAAYLQPGPPAAANQSVRLLVELSDGGTATVRRARDVTGPFVQQQARISNFVFAILENNQVLSTGVLAGDPFTVRAYNGKAAPHGTQRARTAAIVVHIPQATQQTLSTRNVEIKFYRLKGTVGGQQDITPAALRRILEQDASQISTIGSISADDLKKALQISGRGRV